MRPFVLLLALSACKQAPVEAPADTVAPPPQRVMPEALEKRPWTHPQAQVGRLSNGIEVVLVENHEAPLFEVQLSLDVGTWLDPKGQEGLTALTVGLLDEGTAQHDAAALTRALATLGSSLSFRASTEGTQGSASGLVRNLEPTLDLMAEVVFEPAFPQAELDRAIERSIASVRRRDANASSIGSMVFDKLVYGDTYRGRASSEASFSAITRDDVVATWAQVGRPDRARLLVSGDVTLAQVTPLLEARFGGWKAPETAPPVQPELPTELAASPGVYFVNKPGATQSVLEMGHFAPDRLDEDHFPFWLANEVLGGSFMARVNLNLREDKSWTYGARCNYQYARSGPALWACSTQVTAEVTGDAVAELNKEVVDITTARPPQDDEITTFKNAAMFSRPRAYETATRVLSDYVDEKRHGLPASWHEDWMAKVEALSNEDATRAAQTYFHPDKAIWVVVGDRDTIGEGLAVLGLPIIELDARGEPVD